MPKQHSKDKPPASITNKEGVSLITAMLQDIKDTPNLQESAFGQSVKESLISMRVNLERGQFFTERMEGALENWNRAIQKWVDRKPKLQ